VPSTQHTWEGTRRWAPGSKEHCNERVRTFFVRPGMMMKKRGKGDAQGLLGDFGGWEWK
jgi:hypothetical protein